MQITFPIKLFNESCKVYKIQWKVEDNLWYLNDLVYNYSINVELSGKITKTT